MEEVLGDESVTQGGIGLDPGHNDVGRDTNRWSSHIVGRPHSACGGQKEKRFGQAAAQPGCFTKGNTFREAKATLASYIGEQKRPGWFEVGHAVWHNAWPEFVPPEKPRRDHLNADTYTEYRVKCSEYNARIDAWEANCSWVCEVAIANCDKELRDVLGMVPRTINNDFLSILDIIEGYMNSNSNRAAAAYAAKVQAFALAASVIPKQAQAKAKKAAVIGKESTNARLAATVDKTPTKATKADM